MDKLTAGSFFSEDHEVTLLVESEGLEKKAASEEVIEFVKNMKRDPDKFYLHINAMGAGEYYGANRNGDYFPEENLLRWYKTFETSPAHVFRHHVNKDPLIAIGKVVHAYYNMRMHRVELICELDRVKAAAELKAIEAGNYPMTSMACHTPYDVCSICANKASSRSMYCSHLNTQLGSILPDGKKVMSLNLGPLKFFDISIVIRPADVTSSVLQKVAGEDLVVGSAEIADMEGVSYGEIKKSGFKKSAVEKMADLIKEIPGEIVGLNKTLDSVLNSVKDPDDITAERLSEFPLKDVISTLAFLGINPSIEFLIKIIAGKKTADDNTAQEAIESLRVYGIESIPEDSSDLIPEYDDVAPNSYIIKILSDSSEASSYHKEFVEKRAVHTGYVNWQSSVSGVPRSDFFKEREKSSIKPLLRLVGAAIIAKIMISNIVRQNKSTGVEKSAELTVKLMDLSVLNELRRITL